MVGEKSLRRSFDVFAHDSAKEVEVLFKNFLYQFYIQIKMLIANLKRAQGSTREAGKGQKM